MSSPEIDVIPSTLLYQEKVWSDQAKVMGGISSQAGSSQVTGNAGYFVDAVNAYNTACQDITIWCGQGQGEMNNIAGALKLSHETYSSTEQGIITRIRQVGH